MPLFRLTAVSVLSVRVFSLTLQCLRVLTAVQHRDEHSDQTNINSVKEKLKCTAENVVSLSSPSALIKQVQKTVKSAETQEQTAEELHTLQLTVQKSNPHDV